MKPNTKPEHILVILPSPMGDAIMATPSLRLLRQACPDATITFAGNQTAQNILDQNPWCDNWIIIQKNPSKMAKQLRKLNCTSAILLSNSFRTAITVYLAGIKRRIGYSRDARRLLLTHTLTPTQVLHRRIPTAMNNYYGSIIEKAIHAIYPETIIPTPNHQMELFSSEQDDKTINNLFDKWKLNPKKKTVIFVPGAAFGTSKCWPQNRYARLAEKLSENNCQIILSCAPNEQEIKIAKEITEQANTPCYNLLDEKLTLGQLKALIKRSDLMVANDTGPCHIAASFNIPLVTLFGPTDPRWTVTDYDKETRIRHDCECGPCQKPVCSTNHVCMNSITVDEVFQAAMKYLKTPEKPADDTASYLSIGREEKTQPKTKSSLLAGTFYAPYNESYIPTPQRKGLVHKAYIDLLRENNLLSLTDLFSKHFNEHRYDEDSNAAHLTIETPGVEPTHLYVKRFTAPSMIKQLLRLLTYRNRSSRAAYVFSTSMLLAEKGILVTRPIFFSHELNMLGENRSCIIFEKLPQAQSLAVLLANWQENTTKYHLLKNHKKLLGEIARLTRTLHDNRFTHRNLLVENFYLSRSNSGQEKLALVNLEQTSKPKLTLNNWVTTDLAQLFYSGRSLFKRTDMMRFLKAYFGCSQLSKRQKHLTLRVIKKTQQLTRRDLKKQLQDS